MTKTYTWRGLGEGERKGLQGGGGECEGSCFRPNPRLVSLFIVCCFADLIHNFTFSSEDRLSVPFLRSCPLLGVWQWRLRESKNKNLFRLSMLHPTLHPLTLWCPPFSILPLPTHNASLMMWVWAASKAPLKRSKCRASAEKIWISRVARCTASFR